MYTQENICGRTDLAIRPSETYLSQSKFRQLAWSSKLTCRNLNWAAASTKAYIATCGYCSPLFAADVFGARQVGAQNGLAVRQRSGAGGAGERLAEQVAALQRLARVISTRSVLGVRDRNGAAGAADGIAEQVATLRRFARVGVTLRVLGVRDLNGAAGAGDGVAEQSLPSGRQTIPVRKK